MSFTTLLLGVYFSTLVFFSFINHPITYCLLLMVGAFSVGGYAYLTLGVSWYVIIFFLVYIGGVYILFIFVSVHNPNPNTVGGGNNIMFFLAILGFVVLFFGVGVDLPAIVENSHFLCSCSEGLTYCFFCMVLLVGFICVSVVVGDKDSFFR